MKYTPEEKIKIKAAKEVLLGKLSKAAISKKYKISTRTLGRWVDWYCKIDKMFVLSACIPEPELDDVPVPEITEAETLVEDVYPSVPEPEPVVSYVYSVCATGNSIFASRINTSNGESEEITVNSENRKFSECISILKSGMTQDNMRKVFEAIHIITLVKMRLTEGNVVLDADTRTLKLVVNGVERDYFNNSRVATLLSNACVSGEDIGRYVKFFNHLSEIPSNSVMERLFDFIKAADIEIDEDGYVLAYKKVKHDFTDVRTGTFDNSVGASPSMPRNQVDDDPTNTCSHGLHVCSKSYLPSYPGEEIVLCKVHPKDFVAIPRDYNDSKARTCGYTVVKSLGRSYNFS